MSDDPALPLRADAVIAHLRAERDQWVTLAQRIYGPEVWQMPEQRLRLAGYDQAIIDAEEWIRDHNKEQPQEQRRQHRMATQETTVGPWQVRCGPLDHKDTQDLWIERHDRGSDGAMRFSATLGPYEALAIGQALVDMARHTLDNTPQEQ